METRSETVDLRKNQLLIFSTFDFSGTRTIIGLHHSLEIKEFFFNSISSKIDFGEIRISKFAIFEDLGTLEFEF